MVEEVREGDLVLMKGSRGVATDKIVSAIRERFPLAVATSRREAKGVTYLNLR